MAATRDLELRGTGSFTGHEIHIAKEQSDTSQTILELGQFLTSLNTVHYTTTTAVSILPDMIY